MFVFFRISRHLSAMGTGLLVVRPPGIPAAKCFIALLVLLAEAPGLRAEIYECVGANGNLRYTNVKAEVKGCKRLIVFMPDPLPGSRSAAPEATAAAAPQMKSAPETESAWLMSAYGSPEPSARLQAVEDWARGSRDSLDPLSYALLDPDESVRARAQELMEETLRSR